MPDFNPREKQFESDIAAFMTTEGGFMTGNAAAFDRRLGLDTATLISFVKATQPKKWEAYSRLYSNPEKAFVDRFHRVVHLEGLLSVLRYGFSDRGIKFRVVYWKPNTTLNPDDQIRYEANILHCTRQLRYSVHNENSIDIVLFVNGIPVVSMELKDQFTGQNVNNAIEQYRFDRASNDAIFAFTERVLVHFAVDLTNVYMTTRLQGSATRFLPFNQGSNGPGIDGGKGNPDNPDGYDTDYLWKSVLTHDRLLELLQKYMHLSEEVDQDTGEIKKSMIFPRYHQLDVVTYLLNQVRQNGTGESYLVQHSAGSGKSNSIAWLAYRLADLHDTNDNAIFHSVIVVTDRRVLDSQLQDTVYQFDHEEGEVVKVDKHSDQLRDAINDGARIIITTLQKFPVIYQQVEANNRKFAIIIDEAHSSQTGDAAKKLKRALADTEDILAAYAAMEAEEEKTHKDSEDKIIEEIAAHGKHQNLSFFAFTATPKDKTLQMFGIPYDGDDGKRKYRPCHVYSMHQAIDEGFILDVLKNYMSFNVYFKIIKSIPDNPELDSVQGIRAIRNYTSFHPHNIASKVSIMLDHFRNVTMHKINGKAKAMVVTSSRLHAVRYMKEFKKQIQQKGYTDMDVLVAFSGEVPDPADDITYTEEKMNRRADGEIIREKALPEAFHGDEYGMLIVAEKYQTGFDEPLLHTMFVDKQLSGIKAVQTLSRLNRTCPGKQDTFILDFVNDPDTIQKSFQDYYQETVLENETDPNVVYDYKAKLDSYQVYMASEIERFADIFYSGNQQRDDLGRLESTLSPAVGRYTALEKEKRDDFKTLLARFIRIYSFITQVCRFFDTDIHKFYVYAKFLMTLLPSEGYDRVKVDDKILLEYYKLEKGFEGSIQLEGKDGGLNPITGEAGRGERKKDPLTVLVDKFNERYGTAFTEMDKVLSQIENDFAAERKWTDYAHQMDYATFMLLFRREFADKAAKRYQMNDEFFVRMFDDQDMMDDTIQTLGSVLYDRLKKVKLEERSFVEESERFIREETDHTPKAAEPAANPAYDPQLNS